MNKEEHYNAVKLNIALWVAFCHWVLASSVSWQLISSRTLPESDSATLSQLFIAIFQISNVAIALLLGLLAYILAILRCRRWLIVTYLSSSLVLIFDAFVFQLTATHLSASLLQESDYLNPAMWSSFLYEIDGGFILNLVFVCLSSLMLWRLMARNTATTRGSSLRKQSMIVGGLFVVALPVAVFNQSEMPGPVHSYTAIATSLIRSEMTQTTPRLQTTRQSTSLEDDITGNDSEDIDPGITNALSALRKRTGNRPNIILVVLESVGATAVFDTDGNARPDRVPTLAQLASSGITFDAVYSPFPGTVRTHVALNTGGRTITWGSVFNELSYLYTGPTLAREFNKAGYQTALFSSQRLDFENLDGVLERSGYQTMHNFDRFTPEEIETYTLNSWGGREELSVNKIVEWIDERPDRGTPFFINYLTVATHHPYDVPEDFTRQFPGDDRKSRYLDALRYTDQAIGTLVSALKQRNLDQNTLVVITGDHGQAFAERHAGNLTHKFFLYDENVRSFMLLADLSGNTDAIKQRQVASIGDIMPTLLALADVHPNVPGRNLLAATGSTGTAYFYKNAYPEKLGLRQANWKYIANLQSGGDELYDIASDPAEQVNLAARLPEKTSHFGALARQWYFATNDAYTARLKGYVYVAGRGLQADDVSASGPKLLTVGYRHETEHGYAFAEQKQIHPRENIIAWTKWVAYPEAKTITYQWISPDGDSIRSDFLIRPEWITTYVPFKGEFPLAQGVWQLRLWDGDQPLLFTRFEIDDRFTLHEPADTPLQARTITAGRLLDIDADYSQRFITAESVTPHDRPAVHAIWKPFLDKKRLWYEWRSPSGQTERWHFDVDYGWENTWVAYDGTLPLQPGTWTVTIRDDDESTVVAETSFVVNASNDAAKAE